MKLAAALAVLALAAALAHADDDGAAFRDAASHRDIDALERLGDVRPPTRWSDDAYVEAARIAEQANDYARASRDLQRAIDIASAPGDGADPVLVQRAHNDLARLARVAGSSGEWTAVVAEEERLVPRLQSPGDPRPALRDLEHLATANPRYPRVAMLWIQIALGWEREGEFDHALAAITDAEIATHNPASEPNDHLRVVTERVRALIRAGRLSEAHAALDVLAGEASPVLVAVQRADLERAELRRDIRWAMYGLLAALLVIAAVLLRRAAGSWRGAGRRLLRPPTEALFMVPVAAVLIAIASTGNPLVAGAVRGIVIAGVLASWISGTILRGTHVTLRRAAMMALLTLLAVGAAAYLAVDRGHLYDFLVETWRNGHER